MSSFVSRHSRTLAAAAVFALAVAVYANTLGHGFVLDDRAEVVDNAFLRSLPGLGRAFVTPSWEGAGHASPPQYRPLTTATFWVNYALGGLSPGGYHVVNVILHATASTLVLALALELGGSLAAAALAGLCFAVLPVHVEAVANVAGRKDVLATLFLLVAVLAHGAAMRRSGLARVAAPLALLAALFSKETGLVGVGLLAARDLVFGRDDWRRSPTRGISLFAAYLLATGAYLWARWAAVGSLGFPGIGWMDNPIAGAPPGVRIFTAVAVLGRGLSLLAFPLHLSPDYSYAAIPAVTDATDPRFFVPFAAMTGIGVLAVVARRRWPLGLFAVLWYAISAFPTSNLLVPIGTIFGERLLYLPSVGFCLAVGSGAARLLASRARAVGYAAVGIVVASFSARTWAYASEWANPTALFSYAARAQPRSSRAHRMLGGLLMENGSPAAAAAEFRRAVEILDDPAVPRSELSRPRLELGVALEALDRLDESEALYVALLRDDPRSADALWRLGVVRWRRGRSSDAVGLWREAVAADPGHAPALADLGIAYLAAGDASGAKVAWLRAAAADPGLASVWYRLGGLYEREGNLEGARTAWQEFLRRAHDRYPELRAEVAAKLGTSAAPR